MAYKGLNPSKPRKNTPKGKSTYGPAMQACSPLQRRFVEALYERPDLSVTNCLYRAGYKGNGMAAAKMVQRLKQNQLVQDAIQEVGATTYRTLLPKAIGALDKIVDDPDAKDRVKVLHGILDRTGLAVVKETHTTITHTFDRDSVIARIAAVLERNPTLLAKAQQPPIIEATIINGAQDEPEHD